MSLRPRENMSGNPVIHWFGQLRLAYKYIVVFLSILLLTIIAGFIKVLYNRRKLAIASKKEAEEGIKDDVVELNQREKDEGDLFGVRAIEAGFYAGVAQSRPTSRAASRVASRVGSFVDLPTTSRSTLVGASPLLKGHSDNASVASLHSGPGNDGNSIRQASPPTVKLQPSEAELNGRRTHSGAIDMSLRVPPSPGHAPNPTTHPYSGFHMDDEDYLYDQSASSRPGDFHPHHYSPALTLPSPDALQVSYHHADSGAQSQAASFNGSPASSPTPPPPGNPPAQRLPTLPLAALRKDSRSPSPEDNGPFVRVHSPTNDSFASPIEPQAQAGADPLAHHRHDSDLSIYSHGDRLSTFQAYQAYQKHADRSISPASADSETYRFPSLMEDDGRDSMTLNLGKEYEHRPSHASFLAPLDAGKDSRLSDFYDAYYRNSHLGLAQPAPVKHVDRHSTIVEVDTPMASPMFPKFHEPGAAF